MPLRSDESSGAANEIQVEHLSARYGGRQHGPFALRDVSLRVPADERLLLLGPNGAGKSTLVRVLAGLMAPAHGQVWLGGQTPKQARAQVGVVGHATYLYGELTVLENLRLYASLYGVSGAERSTGSSLAGDVGAGLVPTREAPCMSNASRTAASCPVHPEPVEGRTGPSGDKPPSYTPATHGRIELLLARVGLWSLRDELVQRLSRGQQQRAALARALLHDPPFLLLDEPDTGLDVAAFAVLQDLLDGPRTVLLTTHNVSVGSGLATSVALLHDGRLLDPPAPMASTSPAALAERLEAVAMNAAAGTRR